MKKAGIFKERLHITASSQDYAHRKTLSFSVRRSVVIISTAVLLAVAVFCTYTAVSALWTADKLSGVIPTLQQQIEQQNGELGQYEQRISDMQASQPDSGQSQDGP